MYDVIAIGELLIDFATQSADAEGYPTMKANPGGAPGNFLAALSPVWRQNSISWQGGGRCIRKAVA